MQVRAPGARLGFWNGRPRIPPASLLPVRSGKIASGPPPPLPGGPFRRSSSNAFLASDEPAKAYTQLIRHLFSIPQIGRGWRGRLKPRGIILTEGEQAARSGDHPAHLPHVGDTSLLRLVQGARLSANCREGRDVSRRRGEVASFPQGDFAFLWRHFRGSGAHRPVDVTSRDLCVPSSAAGQSGQCTVGFSAWFRLFDLNGDLFSTIHGVPLLLGMP